jgi:hypothetical protein
MLPNSFDITQFPISGFLPPGALPAPKAFNLIFHPQVFQNSADHIHADVRAFVLKFGHIERCAHNSDFFFTKAEIKNGERVLFFDGIGMDRCI